MDKAMCSADPYPEAKVGDGINQGKDSIKHVV